MSNVLLLRLSAPLQSWGMSSRFSIRDTAKEPSKSGVIGLLCAALGISRDDANTTNPTFNALTKLKFGVRVNREGVMQKDYHTAQNIAKADGGIKETELSTRWYLADADFLVGLESGDLPFLESLQNAVKHPKWQLFLGRKSFVPSVPIYLAKDGINSGNLEDVLSNFRLVDFETGEMRFVLENEQGTEVRQDLPLCLKTRRFSIRRVETKFIEITGGENDGNLSDKNESKSTQSGS
jgi:CRISPR system Cascade subunit CasD